MRKPGKKWSNQKKTATTSQMEKNKNNNEKQGRMYEKVLSESTKP